jgi:hypothetical protein
LQPLIHPAEDADQHQRYTVGDEGRQPHRGTEVTLQRVARAPFHRDPPPGRPRLRLTLAFPPYAPTAHSRCRGANGKLPRLVIKSARSSPGEVPCEPKT